MASEALALDDTLSMAHQVLAHVALSREEYDHGYTAAEQAVALSPNDAEAYEALATALLVGDPRRKRTGCSNTRYGSTRGRRCPSSGP